MLLPGALAGVWLMAGPAHAVDVNPTVSNTTAVAFTSGLVPDPVDGLGFAATDSGEVQLTDAIAAATVTSIPNGGAETADGAAQVSIDLGNISNSLFRARSEVFTAPPPAVPTPPPFNFLMQDQSLAAMTATLSTDGLVGPGETAMVNLVLNVSGTLVYNDPAGTAAANVLVDPFDPTNTEIAHDMSANVSALLLLADALEVTDDMLLDLDINNLPVASLFNGSVTLASKVGGGAPDLTRDGDWADMALDGDFVMVGACTAFSCEVDINTTITLNDVQSIGFGQTFEVGLILFTSVDGISDNVNDGRRLESNFFDTASFHVTLDVDVDTDGDGIGNNADPDDDNDSVPDNSDNCPLVANPGQENNDGDAEGDACDVDDDNDGVPDGTDAFPLDATESVDTDGDGIGNNADPDDDNDGLPDTFESDNGFDPLDSSDAGADPDGDSFSTLDEFLAGSDPLDAGSTPLSGGDTFVQGNLTGFWHSYAYFDNATGGNDPGWDICSPEFDPAGAIVSGGCVDADDFPAVLNGSAALTGNGAVVSVGQWMEGVDASYYQLDTGKTVFAGVATSRGGSDDFPTLDLTIKEGSGYQQDDLTGTWHRYRYSDHEGFTSEPRWTYGEVIFDATGLISDSAVFASDAPATPSAPWVGSATLAVDGEVLPAGDWVSSETAFSLSMDAGRTVVAGVATRNALGALAQDHQLWVKQGSAYTQGDLEGTWYLYGFADSSSGIQMPEWTRHTLVLDAAGTVVDGSGVHSEGTLQPHGGAFAVGADGRVTLSGALAAGLLFQDLRMDAGHTVIAGVLSVDLGGEPFERLVVAVKSGSARPEILSPIPGSVLAGASATWQWTDNGNLVTEWWLTVGTSVGGSDLYNSGSLAAVSREHTVSGLPTAGETLFVRLLYKEDGLWLSSDVQYTAFTGTGPAPTPPPPDDPTPAPTPPPPTPAPAPPFIAPSGSGATGPGFTTTASAPQSDSEEVTSAPDLSTWGLLAMILGIWIMVGVDPRRRAARR